MDPNSVAVVDGSNWRYVVGLGWDWEKLGEHKGSGREVDHQDSGWRTGGPGRW